MPASVTYTFVNGTQADADQVNQNFADLVAYLNNEAATVPTGMLAPFAGNEAPPGYLLCDGSAVSRSTYSDLFSVIGTTYGAGDGSTTFNVPNLQGRVPVGKGAHTDVNALGKNEGKAVGERRPQHKHGAGTLAAVAHSHGSGSLQTVGHNHSLGGGASVTQGPSVNVNVDATLGTPDAAVAAANHIHQVVGQTQHNSGLTVFGTTGSSGADVSGETEEDGGPAYLVVNYIIKT